MPDPDRFGTDGYPFYCGLHGFAGFIMPGPGRGLVLAFPLRTVGDDLMGFEQAVQLLAKLPLCRAETV